MYSVKSAVVGKKDGVIWERSVQGTLAQWCDNPGQTWKTHEVIENFIAAEAETLPDCKERGREETKGKNTVKIPQTGNNDRATWP